MLAELQEQLLVVQVVVEDLSQLMVLSTVKMV